MAGRGGYVTFSVELLSVVACFLEPYFFLYTSAKLGLLSAVGFGCCCSTAAGGLISDLSSLNSSFLDSELEKPEEYFLKISVAFLAVSSLGSGLLKFTPPTLSLANFLNKLDELCILFLVSCKQKKESILTPH